MAAPKTENSKYLKSCFSFSIDARSLDRSYDVMQLNDDGSIQISSNQIADTKNDQTKSQRILMMIEV